MRVTIDPKGCKAIVKVVRTMKQPILRSELLEALRINSIMSTSMADKYLRAMTRGEKPKLYQAKIAGRLYYSHYKIPTEPGS